VTGTLLNEYVNEAYRDGRKLNEQKNSSRLFSVKCIREEI
jgi:hypothetical protein